MKKLFQKTRHSIKRGFTLIEMIVVVAIFGILTAVLVFNHTAFTSHIVMTNMAYEIALTLREAQVYGLGARGVDRSFENGYGVHFSMDNKIGDDVKYLTLFTDRGGNGGDKRCDSEDCVSSVCNTSKTDTECVKVLTLSKNIHIVGLQVSDGADPINEGEPVDELNISFLRPNPNAHILGDNESVESGSAAIIIRAPEGDKERAIIVQSTGQISVQTVATAVN